MLATSSLEGPVGEDPIAVADQLAVSRDYVLSRRELEAVGICRDKVRQQIARGRWVALGLHSVGLHRGPLTEQGLWRHALHEVGSNGALDGASALHAAGLVGYDAPVHISVRHGWQPSRIPGVVVKELRHWRPDDVVGAEIRRVKPAVAAVRQATWARSGRQAALVLVMTVQQRIARGPDLFEATRRYKRMPRRRLIEGVIADVVDGVHSLGELDFARECRRRGLPQPSRQRVRKGRNGRIYLDVYFDDFKIIVEIEGAHHDDVINSVDDALRQNEFTGADDDFLRLPVIGFRTDPELFMQQLERKLRRRGWRSAACG